MAQTEECVLVCVTDQASCARLIRAGRARADQEKRPLRVLHVRTREKTMMGNPDISSALNDLYRQAREADAEMEIISSPSVADTIADYARRYRAAAVLIGEPRTDRQPDMYAQLSQRLFGTALEIVPQT